MAIPSIGAYMELEISYLSGRNAKWYIHFENNLAVSNKVELVTTVQFRNFTLKYLPPKKTLLPKSLY